MWRQLAVLIVLNVQLRESLQASSLNGKYYMAAVVEFAQTSVGTADNDTIEENTNRYVKFIHTAGELGADIIVFPEMGLTGLFIPRDEDGSPKIAFEVPDPATNFNPCANESESVSQTLVALSCAAANASVYSVINLPEVVPCPAEAACKGTFYNTNIVFDRRGNLIARYRKFNLYGELGFSAPKDPDHSMFDTDFGVTFGMITCFDIMFYEPAIHLVQSYFIKDVIMPTAWFSEMPFLTAVQAYAAWSVALEVNLLVAGYNLPKSGSTGSSIHGGLHGTIAGVLLTRDTTTMLVAPVPKGHCYKTQPLDDLQQRAYAVPEANLSVTAIAPNTCLECAVVMKEDNCTDNWTSLPPIPDQAEDLPLVENESYENLRMIKDHFDLYTLKNIVFDSTSESWEWDVCHGSLCCNFRIVPPINSSELDEEYQYHAAIYSGKRKFGGFIDVAVQFCGVFACGNSSVSSCGTIPYDDNALRGFGQVTISGNFHTENAVITPNTLGSKLLPLKPDAFVFTSASISEAEANVTMRSTENIIPFYTFGIYSRDFAKDGSSISSFSLYLMLVVCLFLSSM